MSPLIEEYSNLIYDYVYYFYHESLQAPLIYISYSTTLKTLTDFSNFKTIVDDSTFTRNRAQQVEILPYKFKGSLLFFHSEIDAA